METQSASRWLCDCLSLGANQVSAAALGQLSSSDWRSIVQQSLSQGVVPLLYKRLRALRSDANIPGDVLHVLRDIYLDYSGGLLRLQHQLSTLLKVLQDDGIPAIALKGAHLAQVVYEDVAIRPMRDLDILVRKDNLTQVEEKLLRIGYVPHELNPVLVKSHYHLHYIPANSSNTEMADVEVHWDLVQPTSPFKLDIAEIWERAQPAKIAGVDALVLSVEDLLLYLCLHIVHVHTFAAGIKSYYDIAEVIRFYQDDVDWEQLQCRARQWGADRSVYLTLRLAQELLGAAVPGEVLAALESRGFDSRLMDWAKELIFSGLPSEPPQMPEPSFKSLNLAQLWKVRRLRDKVAILFKGLFPPLEEMARRYPVSSTSRWIYLYYLPNLKNTIVDHASVLWQLWRRDEKTVMQAEEKLTWDESKRLHAEREGRKSALVKWLSSA